MRQHDSGNILCIFLSSSSSASKSTIFTHYINMSQKDIQKLKSLASWQEAFSRCGCHKQHHIYRKWWMVSVGWTEQLLMSGFITFLLHVASTASTVCAAFSRLLLLLLREHWSPPPSFFPLSNPVSLNPLLSSPCHFPCHPSFVVDVPVFLSIFYPPSLPPSNLHSIFSSLLSHRKLAARCASCSVL